MNKTVILIGNPVSGKGAPDKINEASRMLRSRGCDVQLMLTEKKGDAETFARQVSGSGNSGPEKLIIAAGGDGTYNEVVNGIAGSDAAMAIIPLGTTNVLAKELGIPEDIHGAVDTALSNRNHSVALGRITMISNTGADAGPEKGLQPSMISRYFVLMAGIGFDGEVVYRVKTGLKKYSGKGAYVWSGLDTLLKWKPEKLSVGMNNRSIEGYSAIIFNASKYAGHFIAAPDAVINEPYLYAFVMKGRKRADIVRYFVGIARNNHLRSDDIIYEKTDRIEISGNAHIQIDGDYAGKTPAKIETAPGALKLIY